jgi:hypothetical protein
MEVAAIFSPHINDEGSGSRKLFAPDDEGSVNAQSHQIPQDEISEHVRADFAYHGGAIAQPPQGRCGIGSAPPHTQEVVIDQRQLAAGRRGADRTCALTIIVTITTPLR